jgi:hypothetical protein
VTRLPLLSRPQIGALFDPLTDQRELVRHYTLYADVAMIRRCRGDHILLAHGDHTPQLAAARANTPELNRRSHAEEVLADRNAPSAQAIELGTPCLQFDGSFGKHLGILMIINR